MTKCWAKLEIGLIIDDRLSPVLYGPILAILSLQDSYWWRAFFSVFCPAPRRLFEAFFAPCVSPQLPFAILLAGDFMSFYGCCDIWSHDIAVILVSGFKPCYKSIKSVCFISISLNTAESFSYSPQKSIFQLSWCIWFVLMCFCCC